MISPVFNTVFANLSAIATISKVTTLQQDRNTYLISEYVTEKSHWLTDIPGVIRQ